MTSAEVAIKCLEIMAPPITFESPKGLFFEMTNLSLFLGDAYTSQGEPIAAVPRKKLGSNRSNPTYPPSIFGH